MGTRHLSLLTFLINDDSRPLLLNSVLRDDNGLLKVELTNPDMVLDDTGFLAKGTLHLHREKFILEGRCHEQISVANYSGDRIRLPACLRIDADFADTFEVRGMKRDRRGRVEAMSANGARLHIQYLGLDNVRRHTRIHVHDLQYQMDGDRLRFLIEIPPHGSRTMQFDFYFCGSDSVEEEQSHADGLTQLLQGHREGRRRYCGVRTSNDQFDSWIRRSTDDLVMMTTKTRAGFEYPYAGIPWFAAAFGRDGIITALECLWANHRLARGVLGFLAATQALEANPERDAQPGKIVHEIRYGEMANLNEIPFGQYYGSVDSTPLFLILCGAYYQRTGDLEFLRSIWPAIERAYSWINTYGDHDGDGFIEYKSETPRGLAQQGWKDSHDSVFHADGSAARGPIALCEVQAYVYMAKRELAVLHEAIGRRELALTLKHESEMLKSRFNRDFWLEDLGTYALALDGDKKPCRVLSSNVGQCLFTGIIPPERASSVVDRLFSPASCSGWGVRTIEAGTSNYNPMSYHNGSVWPHDNGLIALGLHELGFKAETERIFEGIFRASTYMDLLRLPEVFCGFGRREGEAPTLYHHACAPQAWAAGAVYICLQAALGLSIDARGRSTDGSSSGAKDGARVCFMRPRLPDFLEAVRITNLQAGDGKVDLLIQNYGSDVSVQILDREGNVTVTVEK